MSLITSCPACGTMFRVVPDQLKISEGWVRCGHCGDVFDATAHLSDESTVELVRGIEPTRPVDLMTRPLGLSSQPGALDSGLGELAPPPEEPESEPMPEPEPEPATTRRASAPLSDIPGWEDMPPPASSFLVEPQAAPAQPVRELPAADAPASTFGSDSQSLEPSPLDSPFVFRRSDLVPGDGDSTILPPAPQGRASTFDEEDAQEPTPSELEDVSFVRQARRKAFWRRPLVRVLLSLVALALAGLLALQVAWQEHDRLAAMEPALKPALVAMCEVLQCQVGPPRQIESVVIESSGFNRLRNDTYRLSFTLRNTARMPVAVPAMELTLTDAQDQPVVRRVLTPADLGMHDAALAAAGDWSGSFGLQLPASGGSRIAGYRLLAFYP